MKAAVILGPTAAGKSRIALTIAELNFNIISADSVQVYRFLDIGSGKPDKEDLKRVKHYLIDVADPDYSFNVGDYTEMAGKACDSITADGRIPLFVGGTGLYIDSFFKGLSNIPDIEESVREKLFEEIKEKGSFLLYEELKMVDPEFASRVHPHDSQRIMRGLQVYRGTGRTLSSFYMEKLGVESDETLYIGIAPEKQELHKSIELRVDMMLSMGFVEEVERLRSMGYSPQLPSMRTIGYAEINDFLDGFLSYIDAVDKIKVSTKKYAKRQMTWFQRNKKISWFMPEDVKKIRHKIENWLNY